MKKKKNETVVSPSSEFRGNPIAWRIFAQRDWRESQMPQGERHKETRRNEMFLMNVSPREFTYLRTIFPIGDFKRVRLGELAFDMKGMLLGVGLYRPMFGSLKRGARLRRKENKVTRQKRKVKAKA